jgi:type II secretory pathway pseudopilin PulG
MTWRARLRSERGMAVPTVLMLLIVGLGMSSAALVATTQSQSASTRDTRVKQAIAAADAGIERAVYRENKIVTTTSLPCVIVNGVDALVPGPPDGDNWCRPVTRTIGTNTYTYRVKPWTPVTVNGHDGRQITIVTTGTSGAISRRISEVAFAPSGTNVFGLEGAIGASGITMTGNSRIAANAGTNGSYSFSGGGPIVCGNMRYGPSSPPPSGHQCAGYQVTQGSLTLPPPSTFYVTQLNNDSTARFFAPDKSPGDTMIGNVTWDPPTLTAPKRDLKLSAGGVLTLGGDSYLLCTLKMSGSSTLIMAAGAQAKLFFDSPENCGLGNNASQIDVSGGSRITSTSYNPAAGAFDLPGLYVVGSDSLSTSVSITGNGSDAGEFILYAPRSDVTMTGNALTGYSSFFGAVAGKTLKLTGNAQISKDPGAPSPDIPTVLLYGRQRYVECTGATGSAPDANC